MRLKPRIDCHESAVEIPISPIDPINDARTIRYRIFSSSSSLSASTLSHHVLLIASRHARVVMMRMYILTQIRMTASITQLMELFFSETEPKTYVAIKIGYTHLGSIMMIGDEKSMRSYTVALLRRFERGITILRTEEGYQFNRGNEWADDPFTFQDTKGKTRVMKRATKDHPYWSMVERMRKPSQDTQAWTEVDDSILRGWRKDLSQLAEVFPNRTFQEIKDRIVYLHQ